MSSVSVISLNIEGDKHFDRWIPVVRSLEADVVCLQEVFAVDVAMIERELGMRSAFAPMMSIDQVNRYGIAPRGLWGVALLSKQQPTTQKTLYYSGSSDVQPFLLPNDASRALIMAQFRVGEQHHWVGCTHFTWSGDGKANAQQQKDVQALLRELAQFDRVILGGDFNAPRGGEIHTALAAHLRSTVPEEVTTTIDGRFHYAGDLQLVVDDILVSREYTLQSSTVIEGLSDHKAVHTRVSL